MSLTVSSFFNEYINHPLSKDLSFKDKVTATVISLALGILTLGIAQATCAILQRLSIKRLLEHKRITTSALVAMGIEPIYNNDTQPTIPLQFENMGETLQKAFIGTYYKEPLPERDRVTVPDPDNPEQKVFWHTLTPEQKIRVNNYRTRKHNQLAPTAANKRFIDRLFMPEQEAFLPSDPRQSHGCDHAARVAIFTPIFTYLYGKYHPDYNPTANDVLLSQFIAAGHDAGRQSEGPDVYDEDSAAITLAELKKRGIEDDSILKVVKAAIENKDSDATREKPFIAKLVQNADCAEFARLLLTGPIQGQSSFQQSEGFLDIYKELSVMAGPSHDKPLKNGRTFEDFHDELSALRFEMNELIFKTHSKDFRIKASSSGKNYYDEILSTITPSDFPVLCRVLGGMKIIPSLSVLQDESKRANEIRMVDTIANHIQQGIETIETNTLMHFITSLNPIKASEKRDSLMATIQQELTLRERAEKNFVELLALPKEASLALVTRSFASLPFLLREHFRPNFQNYLELRSTDPEVSAILAMETAYASLNTLLKTYSPQDALSLTEKAQTVLDSIDRVSPQYHDPRISTACALALEKATLLHVDLNHPDLAKQTLTIAQERIHISPSHPIVRLCQRDSILSENGRVLWLHSDCQSVRKRKIRLAQRVIHDVPFSELSFDLTSKSRLDLSKTMSLLDPSQVERVPALYFRHASENGYTERSPMQMGEDFKIHVSDNIEIFVGATPENWIQHHLLRLRVKEGTDPQEIQTALASIGLPTALMTSREEDKKQEALARILSFRYPRLMPAGNPEKDARKVYEALPPDKKAIVDEDLRQTTEALVGPDQVDQIVPTMGMEAWRLGARALGTFISAGGIESTANILVSIIKKGVLSSEERFQQGILGLGCVPESNYRSGSGNQVFTRIVTKKALDSRFALDRFAIRGAVFLLLDLRSLERMPYSYLADRNGVRNPEFRIPFFWAQKQLPVVGFHGQEMIAQRPDFDEGISELSASYLPLNETMFDHSLGPQYIKSIIVQEESERKAILKVLKEHNVTELNGVPIEFAVVVSSCLHPGLVKDCAHEEPPFTVEN